MILSFLDSETARIWDGERSSLLPPEIQLQALIRLRLLNRAKRLDDLRIPPGNRLEALQGKPAGQHVIRIDQQWRICFRWTEGGPADVEIADGH